MQCHGEGGAGAEAKLKPKHSFWLSVHLCLWEDIWVWLSVLRTRWLIIIARTRWKLTLHQTLRVSVHRAVLSHGNAVPCSNVSLSPALVNKGPKVAILMSIFLFCKIRLGDASALCRPLRKTDASFGDSGISIQCYTGHQNNFIQSCLISVKWGKSVAST